ncbi:hypothetical protein M2387_001613 [Klebsiella sp. BIGb0407]|nr:hypothetical protein [Klebsiella sp. BIGb0407]
MTDNDRLCVFDRFVTRMLIFLKQDKNNQRVLQTHTERVDEHSQTRRCIGICCLKRGDIIAASIQ